MVNPNALAHHVLSGSPSGQNQQGHIILQLQNSIISPEICQATISSLTD
jgi:hypothetical protein